MNKKVVILLILILLISIIVVLFPKNIKETYAVGTTLADTVISLSSGSSWSSGASGVYYTNSHEYRYVGSDVNNYVSFNNDLYRIIGVFDSNSHGIEGENLVKLIRSRKIGSFSWGIYDNDTESDIATSYKNSWTSGNLIKILNEYFYNKTNTSDTYGNCGDWTDFIQTDFEADVYYRTNDCSDIVGYGIDSSLRNYIENVVWYISGVSNTSFEKTKQNFYSCERGQHGYCSSSASTNARIGLLFPSDFMYASGNYSDTDTTVINNSGYNYGKYNWLFEGSEWTITPYKYNNDHSFYISDSAVIYNQNSYFSEGVRPTFYLKSSVYVTGGNGSFDTPYTIACDDCTE